MAWGCDVGDFYCFLGVLRENQRGILEFGLELGGFKPYYIIFGVENQGAVGNKNTLCHIVSRKCLVTEMLYFREFCKNTQNQRIDMSLNAQNRKFSKKA